MKSVSTTPFNFTYSYLRIWIKNLLIILGLGVMFYGLYMIYFSFQEKEKTLWILDTSLSMVVQDIEGDGDILLTRLNLAQSLILSGRTLISGDHALMTFGDSPRLILPFLDESEVFVSTVRGMTPTLYNSETDIAGAIAGARAVYGDTPMRIIILTDGEETSQKVNTQIQDYKNSQNITIIGIGTSAGGPMLQGYDANGKPRYKQYEGKDAISRLDAPNIARLTDILGARSYLIDSMKKSDALIQSLSRKRDFPYEDKSQIILIVGITLLLSGLMLSSVRYIR